LAEAPPGGRGQGLVLLERIDVGHHDHHDVVEVVGDAAGELADCFHLLRLLKLGLQRLAMRDIDDDAAQRHDLALGVAHRPEVALDREQRPVSSTEHRFSRRWRGIGPQPLYHRPAIAGLGIERLDVDRAEIFVLAEAEHAPPRGIGGDDASIGRAFENADRQRFDQRLVLVLRLAQLFQDPVARGDVVGRHQQRRPAAILDRMHGLFDVDDRAVLLAMPQRRHDMGRVGHETFASGDDRGQVLGWVEVVAAHRQQLLARPAILSDGGVVGVEQPQRLAIDDDGEERAGVEQPSVAGVHGLELRQACHR
jgi:hypothetical protein